AEIIARPRAFLRRGAGARGREPRGLLAPGLADNEPRAMGPRLLGLARVRIAPAASAGAERAAGADTPLCGCGFPPVKAHQNGDDGLPDAARLTEADLAAAPVH